MVEKDISNLKVDDLRKLCKERGLLSAGKKKAELIQLLSAESPEEKKPEPEKEAEVAAPVAAVAETVKEAPEPAAVPAAPVEKETPIGGSNKNEILPATPEPSPDMTEAERLRLRAAKFGLSCAPVEEEKRKARANRFDIVHPDLEAEKRLKRSQKFGLGASEDEKRMKRLDRFEASSTNGVPVSTSNTNMDEKKAARIARFASTEQQVFNGVTEGKTLTEDTVEQKKRRLARFGAHETMSGLSEASKKKARAERFSM